MTVFGKKLSEYIAFQKVVLIVVVVVGILKLGMSLAGVPDASTRWVSITVVGIAATLYYGIVVHTKGFGTYRHLLPLLVIQSVFQNAIVIVGIVISAATGRPNIFTAPEYGGETNVALHIAGHVVGGMIVGPLLGWLVAALTMWITKKVSPGPTRAATAPV
jgi:hypothetical protein